MTRKVTRALIMAAGVFVVAGCTSTRTVEVRVLDARSLRPVHGVHVRAIPVGVGTVPLPVSGENLKQTLIAPGPGGVTDAGGVARLVLDPSREYEVVAEGSPFADARAGGEALCVWTLHVARGTVRPAGGDNSGCGFVLEFDR